MDDLKTYYKNQAAAQPEPALTVTPPQAAERKKRRPAYRRVLVIAAVCAVLTAAVAAAASPAVRGAVLRAGHFTVKDDPLLIYDGLVIRDGEIISRGAKMADSAVSISVEVGAHTMSGALREYLDVYPGEYKPSFAHTDYRFDDFASIREINDFLGINIRPNKLLDEQSQPDLIRATLWDSHSQPEDWQEIPLDSPAYADASGWVDTSHYINGDSGELVWVHMTYYFGRPEQVFSLGWVVYDFDYDAFEIYTSPTNGVQAFIYVGDVSNRDGMALFVIDNIEYTIIPYDIAPGKIADILKAIIDAYEG